MEKCGNLIHGNEDSIKYPEAILNPSHGCIHGTLQRWRSVLDFLKVHVMCYGACDLHIFNFSFTINNHRNQKNQKPTEIIIV